MVFRELAASEPERYRANLGLALAHLGGHLSELGREADAETARRTAEAIGD